LTTPLCTWLFVCEHEDDDYPHMYPTPLFEMLDASVPDHWTTNSNLVGFTFPLRSLISVTSYHQLATDPDHWGALVDGDSEARRLFRQYLKS
jgi:hypothetical protein